MTTASTSAPSDASRTLTTQDTQPNEDTNSQSGVLRLRGGPSSRPRVVWREDVVDNENMGKKSSKICCIYHKARKFGESSSEESSSDDDSDGGRAHSNRLHPNRHCHHNRDGTTARHSSSAEVEQLNSDDEPNAYERPPGWKKAKGKIRSNE